MKLAYALAILVFTGVHAPAQRGPPVLSSLDPPGVVAGSGIFTLALIGLDFSPQHAVRWNGLAIASTFIDSTRIEVGVPTSLTTVGGTANLQVINLPPGGGTSAILPLVIWNPAPAATVWLMGSQDLHLFSPGGVLFLRTTGNGLNAQTQVTWDGTLLAATYSPPGDIVAQVPASLLAVPGVPDIRVTNPPPGGGTFILQSHPIWLVWGPWVFATTPAIVPAGSPSFQLTVHGDQFVPTSVIRWHGTTVPTTYVDRYELRCQIPAAFVANPVYASIQVFNPAPWGGPNGSTSVSTLALPVEGPPVLTSLSPTVITVAGLTQINAVGSGFMPHHILHADGVPLPTTYVHGGFIQGNVTPPGPGGIPRPGGMAVTLETGLGFLSNSLPVILGSGPNAGNVGNAGTLITDPLVTGPGVSFDAVFEGGAAGAPLSLFADPLGPPPLTSWPGSDAGILAVRSPQAFPLFDGMGLLGSPVPGFAFDAAGRFVLPGLAMPQPALGQRWTLQGAYLDPTNPTGVRLTFARHGFDL